MAETNTIAGMISVMQRAKDGKALQRLLRDDGFADWEDISVAAVEWDWADYDYRIRPTPREFCLRVLEDGRSVWEVWHPWLQGLGLHVREVLP